MVFAWSMRRMFLCTHDARESIHKEVEKVEIDVSGAKSGISVANDLILQAKGADRNCYCRAEIWY